MLRSLFFLLTTLALVSCSENTADAEAATETPATEVPATTTPAPVQKTTGNGTLLCEINGEPWHYTKASGIITSDRKTGARTAIITFKKKLDKGSEGIQLYYDADTHELLKATAELKLSKKGGDRMTGFFNLGEETPKKLPGNSLEGSIDLSDLSVASGTATILNVGIRWEKESLADPEDAVASFTDLRFSGVGYSDLAKEKKKLGL